MVRKELEEDILLHFRSTQGKGVRIHERKEYLAGERRVVSQVEIARRRMWGLLPMKVTRSCRVMDIPEDITTREELERYIRNNRDQWRNEP